LKCGIYNSEFSLSCGSIAVYDLPPVIANGAFWQFVQHVVRFLAIICHLS